MLRFLDYAGIASMLFYAAVHAAAGGARLAAPVALSLACAPLYAASLALLRRGRAEAAKMAFFSTATASSFLATALLLGRTPGLHMYFILVAAMTVLVWPWRARGRAAFFIALNLAGFVWVQYGLDPSIVLIPDYPRPWIAPVRSIAFYSICATTFALIVYFQLRADADARALADKAEANRNLMEQFRALSDVDPLTGLLNRRAMMRRLQEEAARVERGGEPFALAIADIDFFKDVNDERGHDAGDAVLAEFADLMRTALREADRVARWGGEEFLALLPATDRTGALVVADKLRARVAEHAFPTSAGEVRITASVGVAVHEGGGRPVGEAITRADAALYAGKRGGRNRAVLEDR